MIRLYINYIYNKLNIIFNNIKIIRIIIIIKIKYMK